MFAPLCLNWLHFVDPRDVVYERSHSRQIKTERRIITHTCGSPLLIQFKHIIRMKHCKIVYPVKPHVFSQWEE
jgi:hypothetical protein